MLFFYVTAHEPCQFGKFPPFSRSIGFLLAGLSLVVPVQAGGFTRGQGKSSGGIQGVEVHLGKGYEAMRSERFEEAATEFRAALELDPTLVMRARFPLGVALFEQRKYPEAQVEIQQVRKDAGEQPSVYYYIGRIAQEEQNFKGAVENLLQAAGKPPYPDTAFYLGMAYLKTGDDADAEKWLKEATQIRDAERFASFLPVGNLLHRKQGRNDEAKDAFAPGRGRGKPPATSSRNSRWSVTRS